MTRKQAVGLSGKILKDAVTEKDGETYDIVRIVLLFGLLAYSIMCLFALHTTLTTADKTFNFKDFGEGFGFMCAGAAALMFGKRSEQGMEK